MYGAIIGDILGSKYEFHNIKTKNFKLFDEDMFFTDDTVMSLAICRALLKTKPDRSDLSQLTDFLGDDTEIRGINVQMLRDCIGRLSAKGRSAASVNRFIASVRTLFSYCRKFQYIRSAQSQCSSVSRALLK